MNDDELRAFLESATVGDDPVSPAEAAARQQGAEQQAAASAGGPAQVSPRPVPGAEPSFDELIGGRATPVPTQALPAQQAPSPGVPPQAAVRAQPPVQPPAPAVAQAPTPSPVPEIEPLVLPGPVVAVTPPSGDPHLTPLHLPEPTRPYQAAPQTAAASRATPLSDTDFPPTEPLQRSDMPTAAPAPGPAVPPVVSLPPAVAPVTAAAVASVAPLQQGAADYEPISVTGGEPRRRPWLPWVIVAGGAALALIASFFVVNAVTGVDDSQSEATLPAPTQPSGQGAGGDDEESDDDSLPGMSDANPSEESETEETEDPTTPPAVEVGPTMSLPVSQWGITAELSSRFGQTFYNINTPDNLVLNSSLIDSLPESCAAMRQQWGILRVDGTTYEVLKPEQRCAAAPELYDELWGLTAAMVDSITPQ